MDFNPNLNRLFRSGSRAKYLGEIRPQNYLSFQKKRQPKIPLRLQANCKTGSDDLRDVFRVKTNYTFYTMFGFDFVCGEANVIKYNFWLN